MECYNPYIVFLSSVFDAIISIRCTDFRDVITFGILGTVNSRHSQMYAVRKMKENLLIPHFIRQMKFPARDKYRNNLVDYVSSWIFFGKFKERVMAPLCYIPSLYG